MENNQQARFKKVGLWIGAVTVGFIFLPLGITALISYFINKTKLNQNLKLGIIIPLLLLGAWGTYGMYTSEPVEKQGAEIASDALGVAEAETENITAENNSVQTTENSETEGEQESEEGLFLVTRVIDGDTIELENGDRVRYIGIDTPETVDPSKPVQCFGKDASQKNSELVLNKRVRLEKDVSETDRYGRLLRYVYIGDVFVNLELVKQGYAYSYSYPPDVKYQDEIVKAQLEAKDQKRGLWASCSTDNTSSNTNTNTTPTPAPAPATNSNTQNVDPAPAANCNIKGNISSKGEKIYHVPGCGSYNATKIDESKGEKWFCTEQEALNAGWRKALNC